MKIIHHFPLYYIYASENTGFNSQKQVIKVGYLKNYGIINVPNVKGLEGFGYEYLNEIENTQIISLNILK